MKPGISVIICCYNSGNKIIPTLEHLTKQDIPDSLPWEVILVDNCCTDDTVSIALDTWKKASEPASLKVISEKTPGLSKARMAGIYHANYSIICFCDDDNWLRSNYLYKAFHIMEANNEIGILAGRGIAVSDIPVPPWFHELEINYACGPQGDHSGDITDRKWAWGAGMILRNEYMRKLYASGFRHINEDRKGSNLSSGGDSEISFWHVITGKRIWYDENLVYQHFIAKEKLTNEFAQKLMAEHEKSFNALYPYFPLIYGDAFKNDNKFSIFIKAISNLARGKEANQQFVHLSPLFNSRLDKNTTEIMKHIKQFNRTR